MRERSEKQRTENQRTREKNIIGALLAELQTIEQSLEGNIRATQMLQNHGHEEISLYAPTFDREAIYDKCIS